MIDASACWRITQIDPSEVEFASNEVLRFIQISHGPQLIRTPA